jgi:hypothetical protein
MVGPVPPLGRSARWGLAIAGLVLLAVLGLARWLRPDPRGFGTHGQLGLPPCQFRATIGLPCPSCGLTTAFAWMVRGRPDQAWRANPAGCVLAPLAAVLGVWLLAVAARGGPVGTRSVDLPCVVAAVVAAVVTLLAWAARLASLVVG